MAFATSHGTEIYYDRAGQGERAVVFAHGMGGNSLSWWQQVPVFAAQDYRTIAIDHRGFGRSACAAAAFRPALFPEDLAAILDQERIERVALVCQSMGGWTGLPFARAHPDRVSALVLGGTPGGLDTPKVRKAMTDMQTRVGTEGVRANAALAPDFPEREPQKAFLYDQIRSLNPEIGPAALANFAAAAMTADSLAGYAVPTLVISGEHDPLFPPEALHEVADSIPGARIVDVTGVGHSTYYEVPEHFNELVLEFIRKHD